MSIAKQWTREDVVEAYKEWAEYQEEVYASHRDFFHERERKWNRYCDRRDGVIEGTSAMRKLRRVSHG